MQLQLTVRRQGWVFCSQEITLKHPAELWPPGKDKKNSSGKQVDELMWLQATHKSCFLLPLPNSQDNFSDAFDCMWTKNPRLKSQPLLNWWETNLLLVERLENKTETGPSLLFDDSSRSDTVEFVLRCSRVAFDHEAGCIKQGTISERKASLNIDISASKCRSKWLYDQQEGWYGFHDDC